MRATYKHQLRQLSKGLFSSLTDLAIFSAAFLIEELGKEDPITAVVNAFKATKIVNHVNFKRAVYYSSQRGFLEKKQDFLKITALGRKRLEQILPRYERERPWDGKLYLVTYDIPEEKKYQRDLIRKQLQKIGCAMLQKSVWLTCYNPAGVLLEFIKENKLIGLVLISDLKEGGLIGGKNVPEVIDKVYNLNSLNEEYRHFCLAVEKGDLKRSEIILGFLSILKRDPQLPFQLLPASWWGEDAYELYKKALKIS